MTRKNKFRACHLGSIVRYSGVVMVGLLYGIPRQLPAQIYIPAKASAPVQRCTSTWGVSKFFRFPASHVAGTPSRNASSQGAMERVFPRQVATLLSVISHLLFFCEASVFL